MGLFHQRSEDDRREGGGMWEGEVAGKEGNGWMDGYVIRGLGSWERRWQKAEVGKGREEAR